MLIFLPLHKNLIMLNVMMQIENRLHILCVWMTLLHIQTDGESYSSESKSYDLINMAVFLYIKSIQFKVILQTCETGTWTPEQCCFINIVKY